MGTGIFISKTCNRSLLLVSGPNSINSGRLKYNSMRAITDMECKKLYID